MDNFRFEALPGTVFSDTQTRTITGLAIPADATAEKGGRTWRFLHGSVEFGERTPLLQFHDPTRPVGKLTSSQWTDRGLEVTFKVSNTSAGTETLELANDGVLGFSVGIDVPMGGAKLVGKELRVAKAFSKEVSLTPVPAFVGSVIDSVSLSRDEAVNMTENNDAVDVAALNTNIEKLTATFEAFANRPEVQPPPVAQVKEPPLYAFNGEGGKFNFAEDVSSAVKGNVDAKARVDAWIQEKFAVATGDVAALTPAGYRSDLYVGPRPYTRVLSRVITQSTVNDVTPFVFPKLTSVTGPLVAPHVQGVEPALAGGAVWGSQTVTPTPLSGKAEFNREVVDQAGPAVQTLIWNEMVKASEKAAEARIVAMLDGLTLPAGQIKAVNGTNSALADALDLMVLGLGEPDRFAGLVANASLYGALYTARDADGRKLFPAIGQAVNADGTANGRRSLDLNGMLAFQSKDTANSYLVDPSTVYQFLSAPRRLDFDIQVKSIYMGFWQYSAEAITDTTGIIRITHA